MAVGLSALLGPGAGQLYNKEWKKGFILIGFLIGVMAAAAYFFIHAAKKTVEALALSNPDLLIQEGAEMLLAKEILAQNAGFISITKWTIVVLWCYGVVDAYLGAKRRRVGKVQEVQNGQNVQEG